MTTHDVSAPDTGTPDYETTIPRRLWQAASILDLMTHCCPQATADSIEGAAWAAEDLIRQAAADFETYRLGREGAP